MINKNEQVIALVPVRGGSKGIPKKNLKQLGGHPLMSWSIRVAQAVQEIDRVIVSTEDKELADIALQYGAELADRPTHLAGDTVGVYDVIMGLRLRLKKEGVRYVVLLEATSPFRSVDMIREALSLLEKGYDSVASFCQTRTHPDKAWKIEGDSLCSYVDNANPWTTRQELSPAYELTGEVYAFDLDALEVGCPSLMVGRCAPLVVDADLSIDINSNRDLDLARLMFDKSPLAKFV